MGIGSHDVLGIVTPRKPPPQNIRDAYDGIDPLNWTLNARNYISLREKDTTRETPRFYPETFPWPIEIRPARLRAHCRRIRNVVREGGGAGNVIAQLFSKAIQKEALI